MPSVVMVSTTLGTEGGNAEGTGIVLTSSGEILTNHHVVQDATSIQVTVLGNGQTYNATVVGYDATADVAVIQLTKASGLTAANIGDSSTVATGDVVTAIGNALGAGTPSVTSGTVVALDQSITATDAGGANPEQLNGLIQTNTPLQEGDSGGPLIDQQGHIIGMNTAIDATLSRRRQTTGSTESYAIPINTAIGIAKQIESGQQSGDVHIGGSGYLGVSMVPDLTSLSPATVAQVEPGSPAESAGMVAGDTITSIDGHNVDSASTLLSLMANYKPGDRVQVSWTDQQGATHHATVTLEAGPIR